MIFSVFLEFNSLEMFHYGNDCMQKMLIVTAESEDVPSRSLMDGRMEWKVKMWKKMWIKS